MTTAPIHPETGFIGLTHAMNRVGAGQIGFEAVAAEPTDLRARVLISFCTSRLNDNGFLPRASFTPREIMPLLPHLFIAEPTAGTWQYRLIGTILTARLGLDFTGKTLERLYRPRTAAGARSFYEGLAREPRIATHRGRYLGIDLEHAELEFVHIPMLARDNSAVLIFGGTFFLEEPPPRHSFFE
jgi:hypothetical protein